MWNIGKYWINPQAITYVYEESNRERIVVHFTMSGEPGSAFLILDGADRLALLAYLAQHTSMHPPFLVPDAEEIRRCEDAQAEHDARRFDPDAPPF